MRNVTLMGTNMFSLTLSLTIDDLTLQLDLLTRKLFDQMEGHT